MYGLFAICVNKNDENLSAEENQNSFSLMRIFSES